MIKPNFSGRNGPMRVLGDCASDAGHLVLGRIHIALKLWTIQLTPLFRKCIIPLLFIMQISLAQRKFHMQTPFQAIFNPPWPNMHFLEKPIAQDGSMSAVRGV